VNASQARNLPGRPKTDKTGAQWIARLTEMGMLRPSFVPPPEIRALRQCTRQLLHLAQDRTRCWQRLEKTLEDAPPARPIRQLAPPYSSPSPPQGMVTTGATSRDSSARREARGAARSSAVVARHGLVALAGHALNLRC
jgi:hypothetical protein